MDCMKEIAEFGMRNERVGLQSEFRIPKSEISYDASNDSALTPARPAENLFYGTGFRR